MVTAIILAGGTGQRMKTQGLPKQFLSIYGTPIICYTIKVFDQCPEVDQIIVPCNKDWVEYTNNILKNENFIKPVSVVAGGADRTESLLNGLKAIENPSDDDVVLIHDGVRPLVENQTILDNIKTVKEKGNAMTVRKNTETTVYTTTDKAKDSDFKNREFTYTLTAPQSFKVNELLQVYEYALENNVDIPLDASLLYAKLGKEVYLVVEEGKNIKITTPEDYYYLKSILEYKENQNIFGV